MLHITKFVPYVTFVTIGLRSGVVYLHPLWLPHPVAVGRGEARNDGRGSMRGLLMNMYCYEEPSGQFLLSRLCGQAVARHTAGAVCGQGPWAGAAPMRRVAGFAAAGAVGCPTGRRAVGGATLTGWAVFPPFCLPRCGPWPDSLPPNSGPPAPEFMTACRRIRDRLRLNPG